MGPVYHSKLATSLVVIALFATPSFAPTASAQAAPVPVTSRPWSGAGASQLPRMGEAGGMDLSAERRLGDGIARQIFQDPDYLDDPALDGYLQAIWRPLLASAKARGDLPSDLDERFAWQILLVRDRNINAFALPGAYVGVNLGLVAAVGTADELASVLAHELTHVLQRHISRLVARQDQQAPWVLGAMVLGALAASAAKNADVLQAAVVGGQAVAAQTQLNFSRDMEREADRIGLGVLTGAGFDGQGFVGMFNRLQQASRHNDDGSFPYLRSHPLTGERISEMKSRLASGAAGAVASHPVSAQWHALMAARARVPAEPDASRWQACLAEASPPQPGGGQGGQATSSAGEAALPGTLYAAALSALRLKLAADAERLVTRLLALPGLEPQARQAAQWLALDVWVASPEMAPPGLGHRDPQRMAEWDDLARQMLASTERPAMLAGAQARLKRGDARAVAERLQVWVSDHPRDALVWRTLAQAWTAQGQTLRAIRAEAESRVAMLDVDGAVDRLRSGIDLARAGAVTDELELAIIDARYRQMLQRQKELALESKP